MDKPKTWVGRATPAVVSAVSEAFRAEGDGRSEDLFAWQYLNPGHEALVAVAHVSTDPFDEVVACYTSFPVPFQIGRVPTTVARSIDTLTRSAFRGQGLLQRLGEATYTFAREQGIAGVYGFPNDLILRPRETKLGWVTMDPLPMHLRPVGIRFPMSYLRRRALPPVESFEFAESVVQRDFSPPADAPVFFAGVRGEDYVGVRFTMDYLGWRFSRPGANYRFRWVTRSDGNLEAFGASNLSLKRGQVFGQVMCLLAEDQYSSAARQVLRDLVTDLKRRGADVIMAWGDPAGSQRSLFRRSFFVDLPPRLRPIRIHFGARTLAPEFAQEFTNRSLWRLSYLDSDTS